MLDVTKFYGELSSLGGVVHTNPEDQLPVVLIEHVSVRAYENAVLMMCLNNHSDAFPWLHSQHQPLVFRSIGGHLSAVMIFDAPTDETVDAAKLCQTMAEQVRT